MRRDRSISAFSPDGASIVIAGKELARSWDTPLDDLADLPALAARTPYVLSDGVLVRRRSLKGDTIAP